MAGATMRSFYMDLQPDWFEDRDESYWLNVYERSVRYDAPSDAPLDLSIDSKVNGSFQLPLAETETATHGKDNNAHLVEITKREKHWVEVRAAGVHGDSHDLARVVFQAPQDILDVFAPIPSSFTEPQAPVEPITRRRVIRPQLFSVDVSQNEAHVVVGGADGKCTLWDLHNQRVAHTLEGHLLDVTRTKFFPSSKVVLTGSLDLTLRIWSVDNGRCAAILKGHTRGITDLAIVGRGRNVVSSASDGSVYLWCCGTQEIIAAWTNEAQSAAQCVALFDDTTAVVTTSPAAAKDHQDSSTSPNEFETDGKVIFTGLENGHVLGIDMRARELALDLQATTTTSSSITSCAAVSSCSSSSAPVLVTGSENGLLTTWDLRHTSAPLHVLSRSGAAIHRIVVTKDDRVWTAHGDGSCANWSHLLGTPGAQPVVSTQLSGPEYDPVRDLAVGAATGRVFTASRDGLVRGYIPHFMTN